MQTVDYMARHKNDGSFPHSSVGTPPFVNEVVTPHHPDYYKSYGATPATDFDSPIPAPQIASRGRYYFVIEGQAQWTRLAINLLQAALCERGIGSKRSSGYGFFVEGSAAE